MNSLAGEFVVTFHFIDHTREKKLSKNYSFFSCCFYESFSLASSVMFDGGRKKREFSECQWNLRAWECVLAGWGGKKNRDFINKSVYLPWLLRKRKAFSEEFFLFFLESTHKTCCCVNVDEEKFPNRNNR